MFGMNSLAVSQPSELMRLLALSNLAPGGVATASPFPANPAAGSQNPPPYAAAHEGASPAARPGMFGAGPAPRPHGAGPAGRGMPSNPSLAPDGLPYADAPQQPRLGGPMGNSPGGIGVHDYAGDIQGALADNALMPKPKGHKGLFPGKDWKTIAGLIADMVAGATGGTPQFGPMMMRRREAADDHNRSLDMLRARAEIERQERMRPRVEQVGNVLGVLNPDPNAFSFNAMYHAPGSAEQYAQARGFQPGTQEYSDAVQEYRLGSWSDPALEAKTELEGVRYGYRDALQDERLETSRRNTDARIGATKRGQNMTDHRVRRGQDLTDERVRGSAGYQGKGGKGGKGSSPAANSDLVGPVYTRGKVRIQFSKSQNKYVPVR